MELYWAQGSVSSWRVVLALLFKELEVDDRLLDMANRDHVQIGYTSLNPRGRVPTLVDGEVVVAEPLAILGYLDRAYPRLPLFGATSADAARIWQKVVDIDTFLTPAALPTAHTLGRQLRLEQPLLGELREKVAEVLVELDRLEAHCERGPFNAVDAMLVPVLAVLKRASLMRGADQVGLLPLDWSRWAQLLERYEGVKKLEGFARSWPPHWQ
ncbi:MAG: glutathione S-transferase family protein [Myxococcales bacterium]|nr:glutathione S-transferase family protein [Myxococcales bacterium]